MAFVEPRPEKDRSERQAIAADKDLLPNHPRTAIKLPLIERAHPDLGRLGVFWHTQGSGKSYSMAFFTEKGAASCRAISRSSL